MLTKASISLDSLNLDSYELVSSKFLSMLFFICFILSKNWIRFCCQIGKKKIRN